MMGLFSANKETKQTNKQNEILNCMFNLTYMAVKGSGSGLRVERVHVEISNNMFIQVK